MKNLMDTGSAWLLLLGPVVCAKGLRGSIVMPEINDYVPLNRFHTDTDARDIDYDYEYENENENE